MSDSAWDAAAEPARCFDFIVVGGGVAGCVLAARLSADPGVRVLLLEAGAEARSPWIGVPSGYARLLGDARYNWMWRSQAEPGLEQREIDQPAGRLLGGSGSINGMIYVRGQAADYDAWAALGLRAWSWADVLPWFKLSERNVRGANAWHGAGGLWPISDCPQAHPLAEAFIEAAVQAGHPRNDDFNGPAQEGAGYYQFNTWRGRRMSTARAFLQPARRRGNLTVVTQACVTALILRGDQVLGVRYLRSGRRHEVRADREVVLSCGTYGTPPLLERSGIGSETWLQRLGVSCRHALPGVGEGLVNHVRVPIVMRSQARVSLNTVGPLGKLGWGVDYLLRRRGPLAVGTPAGGFFRSAPHVDRPDLQVTLWHYSVVRRGLGGVQLHPFPAYTANVVLLRPYSRGQVHARSIDPSAAPLILHNHLQSQYDVSTMIHGIRCVRTILAQPALAELSQEELSPGAACVDDAALERDLRARAGSVYHPVGSCRMGRDASAVVDEQLRVHGLRGLRIADASVMPTIISGNSQAAVVMIAERAAAWMLGSADGAP